MRKRGDRAWWAWVTVHGERRLRIYLVQRGVTSTETLPREATERDADRAVRRLNATLGDVSVSAPVDWKEAVNVFLDDRRACGGRKKAGVRESTIATYRYQLEAVERLLPGSDPLALTDRDARTYRLAAEDRGDAAATIRGNMAAVAILQRWCMGKGWIRAATWEGVPMPEDLAERTHLEPDQLGAFLRAAHRIGSRPGSKTWPAAAYLLAHGLRTAEAQHLLARDIDLTAGIVRVVDRAGARAKSRDSVRAFPVLSEGALACLRSTFRGMPGDWPAFPTGRAPSKKTHPDAAPQMASSRTKWFERRCSWTCTAAGIDPAVTPHGLRHSVATALVIAGADMRSLGALLGHGDTRVTERYAHATSVQSSLAAARLVGEWIDRVEQARPVLEVV